MRCLRQLTDEQLKATVFLSKENYDILDDELNKNYNMDITDIGKQSTKQSISCNVRVLPSPRTIRMKKISHEYKLTEKGYTEPISFGLSEIDLDNRQSKMIEKGSLRLNAHEKVTIIDDEKINVRYSEMTLVAEISRYLNLSCLTVSKILRESIDGIDTILDFVNKYNDILYDIMIPVIFNALYSIEVVPHTEDVELTLLREPKEGGYYEFKGKDGLIVYKDNNTFRQEWIDKTFHADIYCFDSKPELECFLQYIASEKVQEVYFTGMFTADQGDLGIQYYDPESGRIRKYYPDFFAKMSDGTYQLIEVKGDHMIDDTVVKTKKDAAEEMTTASKMQYVLYAGSQLMKEKVLEAYEATQG